ncbi:hypothetical protein [Bacillus taeanensis]|nr:hypothetical protein [Bacillus taeanensis]
MAEKSLYDIKQENMKRLRIEGEAYLKAIYKKPWPRKKKKTP